MDHLCRIELLGGLRVRQETRWITRFRTQKAGALLAYLAYNLRQPHPREVLLDLLWPNLDPSAGRDNLSTILSSLRHQLEPPGVLAGSVLVADRLTVGLHPAAVTTDVTEFGAYLAAAEQAQSEAERTQRLEDALALYVGPLLPGYYEDWVAGESQRLAEAYLQAARRLVRSLARSKEIPRALDYARRAVLTDPLREESHRDLMRLYVAAGQPSAARQQYHELERALREALGQTPSPATQQLLREIQSRDTQVSPPKSPHAQDRAAPDESPALPPWRFASSPDRATRAIPSGTVTFLLTDIEGSTAQWQRVGEIFKEALLHHHTLLRREFLCAGGHTFKETGDGFLVAFQSSQEALTCALAAQRTLHQADWPAEVGPLKVRMALHTGDVTPQEDDYHGLVLHRANRMLSAAHGGQILCSEATATLLRRDLESGVRLIDLGVYRLRDMPQAEPLFQVTYPDMPRPEFPPLNAEAGYASHLPLQFTRFFGREVEINRLAAMLGQPETRLLTLTGPGGTGKTRLALETARHLVDAFAGAVWFAPLADIEEADRIPDALLEALRLPRSGQVEPMEQVVEALLRQPTLLVLDNFEQLVEKGAGLVRTLLARVPTLTCLVTSRQRLELAGEHEFVAPPLPTPQSAGTPEQLCLYESVQLFVDRAQIVKPDFQITSGNAAAIAELCARLEGIPLALELATARAQVLTPAQMLAQMEHRFAFLVSRRRDIEERHRTLWAAIDWSYRLLSPELQRFFARLSVFRGGWGLEAAEAVCEEPLALDYLAQLRECSLVMTEERGLEIRFRILETLREYGQERLRERDDAAETEGRHQAYFLGLAEESIPQLSGPDQAVWLQRLETDHDNLRVVLTRQCPDPASAEAALRMANALWRFWIVRGYLSEGRRHLANVLQRTEKAGTTRERAEALQAAGKLTRQQGDYEEAHALAERSLVMFQKLEDKAGIADALGHLGLIAQEQNAFVQARRFYNQSLELRREIGEKSALAVTLYNLGRMEQWLHNDEAARRLIEETLAIDRELGDQRSISLSLSNLASLAYHQEDFTTARALYEESLAIKRALGDRQGLAHQLGNVGLIAEAIGERAEARSLYEECLTLHREIGNKPGIAWALEHLGMLEEREGNGEAAYTLLAECLTLYLALEDRRNIASVLFDQAAFALKRGQTRRGVAFLAAMKTILEGIGIALSPKERVEFDEQTTAAKVSVGEKAFTTAWKAGRSMTLNQAVERILEDVKMC